MQKLEKQTMTFGYVLKRISDRLQHPIAFWAKSDVSCSPHIKWRNEQASPQTALCIWKNTEGKKQFDTDWLLSSISYMKALMIFYTCHYVTSSNHSSNENKLMERTVNLHQFERMKGERGTTGCTPSRLPAIIPPSSCHHAIRGAIRRTGCDLYVCF